MSSELRLNLRIRVNDDGTAQALGRTNDGINRVSDSAASAGRETAGLSKAFKYLYTAVGIGSLAALANEVLSVNREFQSLRTNLSTAVGGLTNAGLAFSFVQEFAAKTPFDVEQVTESFITLKNLGLKPSEEALRSYGNTAAAQSKPIMQMIEAVSDAATGEFERLKEFGIKASQENGKVSLTFQGQTTTIANSASEIEKYLIDLGNTKFGDAMARQSETMNGAISNTGDVWSNFMDHILSDARENMIAKWVHEAGDALHWLDVQMNGAIANTDKLAAIDQRIAANRASLAAHQANGAVGSLIDDFAGYDSQLKKNQIDSDLRAREKLTQAIADQQAAQQGLIDSMGKTDDASAKSVEVQKAAAEAAKKTATEIKKRADAIEHEITALNDQHLKLTLSERDYELSKLAALGMSDAVKASSMAVWDSNKALDSQKASGDKAKAELDSLVDKYNQLTLSARAYYETTLKDKDGTLLSPEKKAPIMQQFDKNTAAEAGKKSIDDARSALDAYNKSLDDAVVKTTDLSATNAAIFDGALGGINTLVGAFSTMTTSIDETTKALAKNANYIKINAMESDPVKRAANAKKYAVEEMRLNDQRFQQELTGARQVAGAAAQMFGERTAAAKAFHAIEIGLSVISMAMEAKRIAVYVAGIIPKMAAGAAEMFAQSGWAGFAGVAAMGAVIAGLGYGMSNSGGSGSSTPPPISTDTGTVLGDSAAKSQSIDKTYQLLKDIHAAEYTELRGINSGISALSGGINNVITRLFQSSGIVDPKIDTSSKLTSTAKAAQNLTTMGTAAYAIFAAPWTMGLSLLAPLVLKYVPVIGDLISGISNFIFGGLFGKVSQSVTGGGIATNATPVASVLRGGNLDAEQYATVATTKKSWFSSSTSYSEIRSAVNADVQTALDDVFKSMGTTMLGLAGALGNDLATKVNNYIIPAMRVELRGLSSEEASKKLNGVISATLDTMADDIFGQIVGQYQALGEGMLETAVRIVTEVAVVRDAVANSGLSLGVNAISIADSLVSAAGGLKEFQQQFGSFFDKFFTDGEKQARLYDTLASSFQGLNMSIPGTREGYKKIVEGLNLANAADQQRYSMLISLSAAADTYYSSLEAVNAAAIQTAKDAANKATQLAQNQRAMDIQLMEAQGKTADALVAKRVDELDAMDASLRVTQQAIYAAQDYTKAQSDLNTAIQKSVTESNAALDLAFSQLNKVVNVQIKAQQDLLNSLTSIADKLHSAMDATAIQSNDLSLRSRSSAQATIQSALITAQSGGSLANFAGLEKALTEVAKPSSHLYSTNAAYALDQAKTAASIRQLSGYADAQVSDAQKALTVLEQILVQAQLQVDVLRNVNTSMLTVPVAMENFTIKLDAATLAQTYAIQVNTDATGSITSAMNTFILAGTNATATQLALAQQTANAQTAASTAASDAAQLQATASLTTTGAVLQLRATFANFAESMAGFMSTSASAWAASKVAWAANSAAWLATANAWSATYGVNWFAIDNKGYTGYYQAALDKATSAAVAANIPGFATGGFHDGGWRIVGENGPELEHTGPSRIFNNHQSKSLVDNSELIAEIKQLRNEVALLRAEARATASHTNRTSKILDRLMPDGDALAVRVSA